MKKVIKNNLFLFSYVIRYARVYIPLILISSFFQAISVTINVIGIKYLVESLENGKTRHCIIIAIIYSVLIIVTKLYFQWTNYYFPLLSKKIAIGMSMERMNMSQKLDYQCYDIPNYYDDYSRALKSGEQQVSVLIGSLIAIASNIVTLISVILVISNYSFIFVLIAISDTLFSYYIIIRQNKLKYSYDYENTRITRQEEYYKNICLQPSVQLENRLFSVIDLFKKLYKNTALLIYNKYKKHLRKYNSYSYLQIFFSSVLTLFSIICAIYLVSLDKLTLGEFASVITGIGSLTAQLLSLIIQFPQFIQNARYVDDYKKIIEYHPTIEQLSEREEVLQIHNIEFVNVSFKYPLTEVFVLNEVSFKIDSTDRIALVGENGSGKTTIVKLLLRLYDPTSGVILINGKNIKDFDIKNVRNAFSAIFQDYNIYSISMNENISFDEYNDSKDFLKKIEVMPQKYITDLHKAVTRRFDENGIVFSGGEAQRLCIARALYKKSDVLILDEPSASLDPINEQNLIETLNKITSEKTLIIISHRLTMCKDCNKILYLENGCIVETGSHKSLMTNKGKYYELFNIQAKKYTEENGVSN